MTNFRHARDRHVMTWRSLVPPIIGLVIMIPVLIYGLSLLR